MASKITLKEKNLFEALRKERQKASEVFKTRGFRGMWSSVVYKYPEKAHFVYELLQNADDVKATEVDIELTKTGLIFKHNGSIHFSVSEENEDVEPYGHINAITGVGNSTKSDDVNKIGKFGVGFKAVFQYTDEPEIYDDKFWFKIVNYVIPELLPHDHPQRKDGETLFYFPFSSQSKSYKEIKDRLGKLDNPILFLKNLKKVTWREGSGKSLSYSKTVKLLSKKGNVRCEKIEIDNCGSKKSLLMFSKPLKIKGHGQHDVQLGYYLTEKGDIDIKVRPKVFCFFPTSEKFDLCFVCHAPFLLTDSRQQLKADEDLNVTMIEELADLQAKSLLFLRDMKNGKKHMLDENIFDIVSLDGENYDDEEDESIVTQSEFYEACKNIISEEKLLLSAAGDYISAEEAYTCNPVRMMSFFKDEQLQLLNDDEDCHFLSRAISSLTDSDVTSYMSEIGVNSFGPKSLAQDISEDFMVEQNHEWVVSFYKFLNEEQFSLCNPENLSVLSSYYSFQAKPLYLIAPIVKTADEEWVSPYTKDGHANVYLPLDTETSEYNIVNDEYVDDLVSIAFLKHIGIKEPSQKDHISHALNKYSGEESIEKSDIENDFENIYSYYSTIKTKKEKENYINEIKGKVRLVRKHDTTLAEPSDLFLDSEEGLSELIQYDEELGTVDLDFYELSINKHGKKEVLDFMLLLGVNNEPKLKEVTKYGYWQLSAFQKKKVTRVHNTAEKVKDIDISGMSSLWENTDEGKELDVETAKYIWNFLANLDKEDWTVCEYRYKYYNWYTVETDSILFERLSTSKWLLGKSPSEVKQEELVSKGFVYSEELFSLFGIEKDGKTLKEMGASDSQIRREEIGAYAESLGLTKEDLEEMARIKNEKKTRKNKSEVPESETDETGDLPGNVSGDNSTHSSEKKKGNRQNKVKEPEDFEDDDFDYQDENSEEEDNGNDGFTRESLRETDLSSMFSEPDADKKVVSEKNNEESKEDEVDDVMQKLIDEEEKHNRKKELREKAAKTEKYSKEWFDALLELEYRGVTAEKDSDSSKSLNISFSKVCKEKYSDRIYVFSSPSRSIPLWVEEIGDIEVKCRFTNIDEVTLRFEVANVRDSSLRLKASKSYEEVLNRIEWSKCTRAAITLKNQIDLMGKLRTAFNSLDLPEGYNLKENLTNRIKFIFGPPGTGKTTTLARKIIERMRGRGGNRILVLAPTNTACDEIARKIIDMSPDNYAWMNRFVSVADEDLEEVVADRESMVYDEDKCCLISTIARLSFDGFNSQGGYNKLMDIPWDMVICDEASMIPLADIMFAVYNFKATPLLIAGDPMQIMPIVHEEGWKNENIYTMVKLDRFDCPQTEPIQFEIENLSTQYRSLPSIGELFSKYAYDGKLCHHRSEILAPKYTFGELELKQINFIPFKVERYDSVFGVKKLDGSNVHIYSVLLTVELFKYITMEYAKNEQNEFSIGIVCPYSPQAQLIESLISQIPNLPECIKVVVGTVHRFQGGQCNMVITVLNPPMGLKRASDKVFLNNKNILNVAISRAQDYLCVMLPHCDTDGYENLYEINRLGSIAQKDPENVAHYTSDQIEEIIFGRKFFIESNTFVTSHQLANVYTKASKRYEIRIDEKSVDIQIGAGNNHNKVQGSTTDIIISDEDITLVGDTDDSETSIDTDNESVDMDNLSSSTDPEDYYRLFKTGKIDIDSALDMLVSSDTLCSYFILFQLFGSNLKCSEYNWKRPGANEMKNRAKLGRKSKLFINLRPFIYNCMNSGKFKLKGIIDKDVMEISLSEFEAAYSTYSKKLKERRVTKKIRSSHVTREDFMTSGYNNSSYRPREGKLYTDFEYGLSDW